MRCRAGEWAVQEGESCPPFPDHIALSRPGGGRGTQQELRAVSASPANSHHPVKPTVLRGLGGVCCPTCGQTGAPQASEGPPGNAALLSSYPLILSLPGSVTVSRLFLVCTELRAALCESLSFVCQVCHVTQVWERRRGPSPSVESEQGLGVQAGWSSSC